MADQLSSDLASLRIQREENPAARRSRRAWIVGSLVALPILGALVLGGVALSARVFKTEVEATEIRMISPAQASILVTSSGYVVAQVTSVVGARLPGRVAEVRVKEGDRVSAGDVLVRLDDAEQRTAIAGAKARALAARARVASAKASLAETSRQFQRERDLAASGASARSVAEDLEVRARALEETSFAAEADADAAEAELRQLEVNLDALVVRAPIDGVILRKPVSPGELVGPVSPTPVAHMADFSTLVVETDVPEARLSLIRPDAPAEIVLDAYPTVRHRGRVVDMSPRVDRAKATVVVRVRFVDPIEGALPDMSARVSFLSGELEAEAMREPPKKFVPASAVVIRGTSHVVFRIDEGTAREESVKLGPPMVGGFELLEGPGEGTRLIASPPATIADGYPVKERNE